MEATSWAAEGEAVEGYFSMSAAIGVEVPRALTLPPTTRYRCFSDHVTENQSLQRCRYGSSFVVHKRPQQEMSVSEPDKAVLCVPRRHRTAFEAATARLNTFQWLAQPRATEEILARFALDRRTGASPNLASLRRAVQQLHATSIQEDTREQTRRAARDAIVDLFEELVLEGSAFLSSALCLDVVAALASTPLPVARLVLARLASHPSATAAASSLRPVWAPLCSALASVALADKPSALGGRRNRTFVDVFARVVQLTRAAGELSLTHACAYGRCLLDEGAAATGRADLIALLRKDVLSASPSLASQLSGSDGSATRLVLGAFLSDVLDVLCGEESQLPPETLAVTQRPGDAVSGCSLGCEVVQYAATHKVPLTSHSMTALIKALAVSQQAPHRLLSVFVFMCVVSSPTLDALHTSLAVAFDGEAECTPSDAALAVLPESPAVFYSWCVQRFAAVLFAPPHHASQLALQRAVAHRLGQIVYSTTPTTDRTATTWWERCLTGSAGIVHAVAASVVADVRARVAGAAVAFLSALLPRILEAFKSSPTSMPHRQLQWLSVAAHAALFGVLPSIGVLQTFWEAATASMCSTSGDPHTPFDLASLLRDNISPECACNVLDVAACNTLAADNAREAAFVKMMDGYVKKKGALAILPFQCMVGACGMTDEARLMLYGWQHAHAEWFVCLPLSLSLTLGDSKDVFDAPCELLRVIQRNDHKRAAIMTGDEALATQAKEGGIQATIYLGALLARLGVQP